MLLSGPLRLDYSFICNRIKMSSTRQHLVPRHCCAHFILEWTAWSELFYKFGNRFACVCIFFPASSSAHRCLCRSFQAGIFQCRCAAVKDCVFCLVAAFHRCRPTVLSSSHCENNPDWSAHTPRVVSLCWFGCSAMFSSCRLTKAEVVALCKFWHFSVSFLIWASVFTWLLLHVCPSSVRRLFQLCAGEKGKFHCVDRISGFSISEDKNTTLTRSAVSAVFRLSRRLGYL